MEEPIRQQMLKSICRSKNIIGKKAIKFENRAVIIPKLEKLANLTLQELRDLTITQVQWFEFTNIGITLSNGQSVNVGDPYWF